MFFLLRHLKVCILGMEFLRQVSFWISRHLILLICLKKYVKYSKPIASTQVCLMQLLGMPVIPFISTNNRKSVSMKFARNPCPQITIAHLPQYLGYNCQPLIFLNRVWYSRYSNSPAVSLSYSLVIGEVIKAHSQWGRGYLTAEGARRPSANAHFLVCARTRQRRVQ